MLRSHFATSSKALVACALALLTLVPAGAGAQGALELGEEAALGARIPSAAPGGQLWPRLARGSDSFLAVWNQRTPDPSESTVVARVLDDRGLPVEDAATVVGRAADHLAVPGVAYGDGEYLVSFADATGDVVVVRLGERGQRLDEAPTPVATDGYVVGIDVVWLGDEFAVVWTEEDEGDRRPVQYGALVGPDGDVRTQEPVLLVDDAAGTAVAGPGGELLVLWSDHSQGESGVDLFGRRFGAGLEKIGEFVVNAPGAQEDPAAVFDGEAYLVAWSDTRAHPEWQIRVASMTVDGAVGESRVAGTHDYYIGDVDVGKTGSTYAVVWTELHADTIYGRRISADGAFADPAPLPVYSDRSGEAGDFELATTPDGTVVVVDGRIPDLDDNVLSIWLGAPGGDATSPALVSRAANGQRSPAVASNGRAGLVVWQDWRSSAWKESFDSGIPEWPLDVYAARLTGSGLKPAGGIRISHGAEAEAHPAVAWNGRSFLAAWTDYASREIRLRNVTLEGSLSPTRSATGPGSWNAGPRLAGTRGRGFVVWFNDSGGFPSAPALRGAGVDRRARPGRARVLFEGAHAGFDVAAAGGRFVVAWLGDDDLYTRTFSARGFPLSKRQAVTPAPDAIDVRIGSGGGRLLAIWLAPNADHTVYELNSMVLDSHGRRVTGPRRIDSRPISPAEVVWDGDHFVAAWHEATGLETHAVEVARIGVSGTVEGREARSLGRIFRSYTQLGVALVDARPLVVYERHAPEPVYGGVSRIFARAVL